MRVRTNKRDDFVLCGCHVPTNSLYINESHRCTAFIDDLTIYVGEKTDNMYLKGHLHIDGTWKKAVFFETGTVFVNCAKLVGRYPEIFEGFYNKLKTAQKPVASKYVGIEEIVPHDRKIPSITPMRNTRYELAKHNADNADTGYKYKANNASIGTDTPVWHETGKVSAVLSKTKVKDYTKKKNYASKPAEYKRTIRRSEYLDQFPVEDWACVIFRDNMFALRDNFAD